MTKCPTECPLIKVSLDDRFTVHLHSKLYGSIPWAQDYEEVYIILLCIFYYFSEMLVLHWVGGFGKVQGGGKTNSKKISFV